MDRGVIVAAVTPRGKRGELDFGAAFDLMDRLCAARVDGIAMFTAAGEYPAFTTEERQRLIFLAAKRARVPLLAGVGSEELSISVELAREASRAGAQGVLLPPPLLFRYAAADIQEYYTQFAAQVGSGTALWIVSAPGLDEETSRGLLGTGLFAGIVAEGAAVQRFANAEHACLAGDEMGVGEMRRAGARGLLSSVACAIPELMVALVDASRRGEVAREDRLDALAREFDIRSREFAPPVAIKVAAGVRGITTGPLAVPVAPDRLKRLDEFREWFRGWLPAMTKMSANA